MKNLIICCVVLLISCNQISHETNSPEGTYTCYHEHEFGKTNDTLIISKSNGGKDIYNIIRHSGVLRTADGRIYPKTIIRERYVARYDEESQKLTDLRLGKIFMWNPEKKLVVLGITEFKMK